MARKIAKRGVARNANFPDGSQYDFINALREYLDLEPITLHKGNGKRKGEKKKLLNWNDGS